MRRDTSALAEVERTSDATAGSGGNSHSDTTKRTQVVAPPRGIADPAASITEEAEMALATSARDVHPCALKEVRPDVSEQVYAVAPPTRLAEWDLMFKSGYIAPADMVGCTEVCRAVRRTSMQGIAFIICPEMFKRPCGTALQHPHAVYLNLLGSSRLGEPQSVRSFKVAAAIAAAAVEHDVRSLCGIRERQSTADFSGQSLKAADAALLIFDLEVNTALTSVNLLRNNLGDAAAAIVAAAKQRSNIETLCGIDGGQTEVSFRKQGLTAPDAVLLGFDLEFKRALTSVNLLQNDLGDGAAAIVAAAKQHGNIKTLCGIKEGQTEANFRCADLSAPDAVLLSFDLEFNRALTSLDLSSNEIGVGGAKAIAGSLLQSALTRLVINVELNIEQLKIHASIDLGHKGLRAEDAIIVAKCMEFNRALKSAKLGGNSIGDEGTTAVSEVIKSNSTLEELELRYNKIGVAGAQSLVDMLQFNRALTALDISGNAIGDEGKIAMGDALLSSSTSKLQFLTCTKWSIKADTTTLDLSSEGLDAADVKLLAGVIKNTLQFNRALKSANLAKTAIGDGGAIAISAALQTNSMLTNLNLRACEYRTTGKITAEGAQAIAKMLEVNTALTSVNLLNNDLGDGAVAIVAAAKQNGNIKTLCGIRKGETKVSLGREYLKAPDAVLLSFDLEFNRSLASLNLCNNSLGEASEMIAKTVLQHPTMEVFCEIPLKKMREDSLTELDLREMNIGTHGIMVIAPLLQSTRALNSINLLKNDIGEDALVHMAAAWEQSTTLKSICGISAGATTADLHDQHLHAADVRFIVLELRFNRALKCANLSNNQFNDDGIRALCEALKTNNNLESLTMTNGHREATKITAAGAHSIANMLAVNRALKAADFSNNNVGDEGIAALSEALKCNNTLEELDLGDNGIGGRYVKKAEATGTTFKVGDTVQWNGMEGTISNETWRGDIFVLFEQGSQAFAEALEVNRALTSVNLLKNDFGGGNGAAAVVAAAKQHGNIKTLCGIKEGQTEANFRCADLSAPDAVLLSFDLEFNRALTSVNLLKNDLGDGAAAIVAAAKQGGNIKTLCGIKEGQTEVDLRSNRLKAPDAVLLSFDLEFNRALESLDLSDNKIEEDGIRALCEALKSNNTLRILAITNSDDYATKINAAGAQSIADMMAVNRALRSTNFGANNIGDEGAIAISTSLENNTTLTHIDLNGHGSDVKIGLAGAQAIAKMLAVNRALTSLDLNGNAIGVGGAKAIAGSLLQSALKKLVMNVELDVEQLKTHSSIDLKQKFLQAEEAIIVAKCMEFNIALTALNVASNGIGVADEWSVKRDWRGDIEYKHTDGRTQKERPQGASSDIIALAKSLEVNRTLSTLDLSNNDIGGVSYNVKKDQLQGATFNKGDTVQYKGQQCIVFKEEDSDGCLNVQNLSGVVALAGALKINRSVTSLDVRGNDLGDCSAALAEVVSKSQQFVTFCEVPVKQMRDDALMELDLEEKQIGDCGAMVIAHLLEFSGTLKNANLAQNDIGDDGAIAISAALENNTTLRELNLQARASRFAGQPEIKQIGAAGAQAMAQMLAVNRSLNTLDLSQNNAGGGMFDGVKKDELQGTSFESGDTVQYDGHQCVIIGRYTNGTFKVQDITGVLALAKAFKVNKSLKSANLAKNVIGDGGAIAISAALESNTTLTQLDLSGNLISPPGVQAITKMLEVNRSLTSVNLLYNHLGEGAAAFAAAAEQQGNIIMLCGIKPDQTAVDFSRWCAKLDVFGRCLHSELGPILGAAGAVLLGFDLKFNTALKSVNLADNDIGDGGAIAISAALETNRTLTNLNLGQGAPRWRDDAKITDRGAQAIAKMLAVNRALTSLDLNGNAIGVGGAKAIAGSLLQSALKKLVMNVELDVEQLKTHSSIDLKQKFLQAEEAIIVAKCMEFNRALISLDLSDNIIAGQYIKHIGQGESLHWRSIGDVVQWGGVEGTISKKRVSTGEAFVVFQHGVQAIAAALEVNKALASVNLLKTDLGDGAAAIVAAAKQNGSIKTLCGIEEGKTEVSFYSNGLEALDAVLLSFDLQFNGALTTLDLSSNEIGLPGGWKIQRSAGHYRRRTIVRVAYQHVDGDWQAERPQGSSSGIIALADSLKVNRALRSADLSETSIGDAGAAALSDALKSNSTLEELKLVRNEIGVAGAQSLASMLQFNRALTSLDLSSNSIVVSHGGKWTHDSNVPWKCAHEDGKWWGKYVHKDEDENTSDWPWPVEFEVDISGIQALANALKVNKTLKCVVLSDNDIGDGGAAALSGALKTNGILETLALRENKVGVAGAQSLADMLQVNGGLTTLDLSQNNIGGSSGIVAKDQLQGASFKKGATVQYKGKQCTISKGYVSAGVVVQDIAGVVALAEALQFNRVLTSADFSANNIQEEGITALSEALKSNNTLEELKLISNDIGSPCITTVQALQGTSFKKGDIVQYNGQQCTVISELEGCGCYRAVQNVSGAVALAKALELSLGALKSLDLCWNHVCVASGRIAQAVLQHPTLELFCNIPVKKMRENSLAELDLRKKHIGTLGAMVIAPLLEFSRALKTLNLSENEIGAYYDLASRRELTRPEGPAALFDCLKENTTLTALDFSKNRAGAVGARLFGKCLEVNRAMQSADFSGNSICDEGTAALSEALKANSTLKELKLIQNAISAAGAQSLADTLRVNRSLISANLACNNIGDEGAIAISAALATNTTLTDLNLQGGYAPEYEGYAPWYDTVRISATGAQAIAKMLAVNRSLIKLSIGGNALGRGIQAICESLCHNDTLQDISFAHTNSEYAMGADGAKHVADMLKINKALTSVNLLKNDLADGAAAIVAAAKLNGNIKTLCGIQEGKSEVNLRSERLESPDAVLLGFDLEFNRSLTSVNLLDNNIEEDGLARIAAAWEHSTTLKSICGIPAGATLAYLSDQCKPGENDTLIIALEFRFNALLPDCTHARRQVLLE